MTGFHQKTLELFDTVNAILEQYEGALTLRQIFYRLVAAHHIENTQNAYTLLSSHLTNARRAGIVDADRIVDRTRQTLKVATWSDLEEFLEVVSGSYRREKWTSQQTNKHTWRCGARRTRWPVCWSRSLKSLRWCCTLAGATIAIRRFWRLPIELPASNRQ